MSMMQDTGDFLGSEVAKKSKVFQVATIAARDAIAAGVRYAGMWVEVADNGAGNMDLYFMPTESTLLANDEWVALVHFGGTALDDAPPPIVPPPIGGNTPPVDMTPYVHPTVSGTWTVGPARIADAGRTSGTQSNNMNVYKNKATKWNGTAYSLLTPPINYHQYGHNVGSAGNADISVFYGDSLSSRTLLTESWNGTSWTAEANRIKGANTVTSCGNGTISIAVCGGPSWNGTVADGLAVHYRQSETFNGSTWSMTQDYIGDPTYVLASGPTSNFIALGGTFTNSNTIDGSSTSRLVTSWTGVAYSMLPNMPRQFTQGVLSGIPTDAMISAGSDESTNISNTEVFDGVAWAQSGAFPTTGSVSGSCGASGHAGFTNGGAYSNKNAMTFN